MHDRRDAIRRRRHRQLLPEQGHRAPDRRPATLVRPEEAAEDSPAAAPAAAARGQEPRDEVQGVRLRHHAAHLLQAVHRLPGHMEQLAAVLLGQ